MHRVPAILLTLAAAVVSLAALSEPREGTAVTRLDAPAWAIRAGATALCSVEVGFACNELGEIYRLGYGVSISQEAAADYYGRACGTDYGPGCYNIGLAYGAGRGVKKDPRKAGTYMKRACKLGVAAACAVGRSDD